MQHRIVLLIGMLLLFSACSEKDYRHIYTEQTNFFDNRLHTSAECSVQTMQNGENPMNRPSYDEYRAK